MTAFVLDASVALAWCFADEAQPYTESVLQACAKGMQAHVASVWPLEITNTLLQAQRRHRVSEEVIAQFLEQLLRFHIVVEPTTTGQAVLEVRRMAQTYGLTAYDAAYLTLAIQQGLPLATLDGALKKAALTAGVPLLTL